MGNLNLSGLYKEYYLKYGTLSGAEEAFPILKNFNKEKIQELIDLGIASAEKMRVKLELSDYEKICAIYADYIYKLPTLITVYEDGFATQKTVQEYLDYRKISPVENVDDELEAIKGLADPDALGVRIEYQKDLKEPYMINKILYTTKKLTTKEKSDLGKNALRYAVSYNLNLGKKGLFSVLQALYSYVLDDKQFVKLVAFCTAFGMNCEELCASLRLQYVDRLEIYKMYEIYPCFVDNGIAMVTPNMDNWDSIMLIKDLDLLRKALVMGDWDVLKQAVI